MSADEDRETPERIEPLEKVTHLVAEYGAGARPLRELIALLCRSPQSLDRLILNSALSRRTVERLIDALGSDLERRPEGLIVRSDRAALYRDRFALAQLARTRLADPLEARMADWSDLVKEMERLITIVPPPLPALDHVTATAETVVRRALWLDSSFDLASGRLLFVGDHDLTSLALCLVNPEVQVEVVDLDDRLLEFVDEQASSRGMKVRCLFADLRFGLPPAAEQWADVVFTDPPYTQEGVRLFCARGLQGLRDRNNGRIVVAYGFGDRQPTLGLQVQQAMQGLHLAFEAILPNFNRYHGAQAVGSSADLYVCRPTPRTWRVLDRLVAGAVANIYTRGPQAVEGSRSVVDSGTAQAVEAAAVEGNGHTVSVVVGGGWPTLPPNAIRVELGPLVAEGLPPSATRRRPLVAVANLAADPGFWLLRVLLAINAERLAVLVPNNHPDLADEAGQQRLTNLVRHKYRLRLRRSTPTPTDAVVEAERVDSTTLDAGGWLVRRLLDRAHGKISNVWREGLIYLADERRGVPLTKNAARAIVRESTRNEQLLDTRLIDLPRHQIADLIEDASTSVSRLG